MVKPEIIEQTPINFSQLKEEISKIKKRDNEFNYRAQKTEEYVNSLSVLSASESKKLFTELTALKIPRLKDTHIQKFIDLMPVCLDDVKMLLQGQTFSVNNDSLKKIISVIDKHR